MMLDRVISMLDGLAHVGGDQIGRKALSMEGDSTSSLGTLLILYVAPASDK